jgi:hypothetical protein
MGSIERDKEDGVTHGLRTVFNVKGWYGRA